MTGLLALWSGLEVIASEFVPETREVHRQERKWAHRVMYQRGRRFNVKTGPMILRQPGKLIAHPNTVKFIEEQVENERRKKQGFDR